MPNYILFFKNFSENYLSLDIIFFDMIISKAGLFSVSDVLSLKIVFPMKSFFGMIILKNRLFSEIGER